MRGRSEINVSEERMRRSRGEATRASLCACAEKVPQTPRRLPMRRFHGSEIDSLFRTTCSSQWEQLED